MIDRTDEAPGHPGIAPRWTSSAKSGVGTSTRVTSRVWFTLSHGILNEIYYPHPDLPCTRDLGLIVTDGGGFFSEEKRDAQSFQDELVEGVPAYCLTNTCRQGRYRIEKEILTDPFRDVLLQRIRFVPLVKSVGDYRVYALLAPHFGANGSDNSARLGDYKGSPMLLAEGDGLALALACSAPWAARSVGFVGVSDGWLDLQQNGRLTRAYARAEHGNIAMIGEVDLRGDDGWFVLSLGFGRTTQGAAHRAKSSLLAGFDAARAEYVGGWQAWQATLLPPEATPGKLQSRDLCRLSAAVLHCHEDVGFPGGSIASLSIPWGFARGKDTGGYHLVWPRDLVEVAGGLLAVGAREDARRILDYLRATQESNGRWPQNMWLDGTPYWDGAQMDETALPILLVDLARREGAVSESDLAGFWPMARLAAGYVVHEGPSTQQGRWEEDSGYTIFTIAAEIAALLVAADLADAHGESQVAAYLRETADLWNASIDGWLYADATDLAREVGVDGYYVRVARPNGTAVAAPWRGFVVIKNREGSVVLPDASVVSADALALVRFGLRAAADPKVVATARVIDATLKVETPRGPAWHRYNVDGYGEHADGAPFDGTGIGRIWPLLVGERGHYELAAGRRDEAARLLAVMAAFASDGGMIPEQVWDSPDLPTHELFFGRPSGSAMPLAWAHAEYLKLARSIADGRAFDMPPQTIRRYVIEKTGSPHAVWRFNQKRPVFPIGKILRVEVMASARVRWHFGVGKDEGETDTTDTGLGMHYVDLPTTGLIAGTEVRFTFHWTQANRWEGVEFMTTVGT